jgi:hypothetical protein
MEWARIDSRVGEGIGKEWRNNAQVGPGPRYRGELEYKVGEEWTSHLVVPDGVGDSTDTEHLPPIYIYRMMM